MATEQTEKNKVLCMNCKYIGEMTAPYIGETHRHSICRLNPPTKMTGSYRVWPSVWAEQDWCGSFEPQEPTS